MKARRSRVLPALILSSSVLGGFVQVDRNEAQMVTGRALGAQNADGRTHFLPCSMDLADDVELSLSQYGTSPWSISCATQGRNASWLQALRCYHVKDVVILVRGPRPLKPPMRRLCALTCRLMRMRFYCATTRQTDRHNDGFRPG